MPYISTKVNVPISGQQQTQLKESFGKAIETLPGKSEGWLMLSFEENCHLYFKGDDTQKLAFVEVKLFGGANGQAYEAMTKELTDILHRILEIPSENIYIKYEETKYWGWNGRNL